MHEHGQAEVEILSQSIEFLRLIQRDNGNLAARFEGYSIFRHNATCDGYGVNVGKVWIEERGERILFMRVRLTAPYDFPT